MFRQLKKLAMSAVEIAFTGGISTFATLNEVRWLHTHTVRFAASDDCTHPSVDHASVDSFQKRHSDASAAARAPCGMRIAIRDANDAGERSRTTTGRPVSVARMENETTGASVVVAAARSANANTFCTLIANAVSTMAGVATPVAAAA